MFSLFFFFNDTATTEIYTLSLHDALPICGVAGLDHVRGADAAGQARAARRGSVGEGMEWRRSRACPRSEEHTSELQSQFHLVCRLLLEKKKKKKTKNDNS